MRIYTRTGDQGSTSLIGGRRVKKYDAKVEAYGTIDELISHVGYLRDLVTSDKLREQLLTAQIKLMTCASRLAADLDSEEFALFLITKDDVTKLENHIDEMQTELQPLKAFVLPGGHVSVSAAHICRTVCRRAERRAQALAESGEADMMVNMYLNRLSDYFFVLARYLCKELEISEVTY